MTLRNLQGKSKVYVFHLLVKVGFFPFYEHDSFSLTWYLVAAESRISKKSSKQDVRQDSELCNFKQNGFYELLMSFWDTPLAVHYEKIRNHLRETATNSAKTHSSARKYEHLRINQIQLRFLHFNQHSITLLGIHMGHWAYKREKYTFINANIKVINTILKVNRDNWHTLKCKHYSLTFLWHCLQFNSIPGQP